MVVTLRDELRALWWGVAPTIFAGVGFGAIYLGCLLHPEDWIAIGSGIIGGLIAHRVTKGR